MLYCFHIFTSFIQILQLIILELEVDLSVIWIGISNNEIHKYTGDIAS